MSTIDGRPRTRRARGVPPKRRHEDKCMPVVLAWTLGERVDVRPDSGIDLDIDLEIDSDIDSHAHTRGAIAMSAIDGRPRMPRAHRVPPKRRCEDKCMPAVLAWLPGRPARLRDRRCACNEPYPSALGRSPRGGRAFDGCRRDARECVRRPAHGERSMTNPFAQWSRASACALAIVCFAPSGAAFAAQATADVPTAGASIASAASTPAPGTPTSAAAAARSFVTSPAAIHGAVVDARTGKPIPAAIVTIDGRPLRADDRGAFSADAAAADIAVRAPGYLATRARAEAGRPVTVALAPFRPKAVYLSVFGITSKTLREAAVDLKGATAINALVVDMKGDRGITPYPSAARRASGAAARTPNAPVVRDFAALVADLHRRGLYLIARIVVFKDDPLAAAHPEWTVRDADGNIWRDREKLRWIDPSLRETWAHNLDVAEEAAKLGFDEIQFDYVRFPDARELRFSVPNTRANRTAAIAGFLRAARERLAPYNVFVAADIFGYVCWNEDDTAIGQQIETLGGPLDYISPMLYPSGFTWGLPGCTQPTADPGQIVRRSLVEARSRTGLPGVRFRPWLQAFRDYAFDRRDFAAAEIRAQVDAAEAADTDGWMLWNARNRYDPRQLPK